MPEARNEPKFECECCGLCCRRDPYYAVSLLDIRNISMGLGLRPEEFFRQYCDVVTTPGGFRYSVILAPDGCPFLKNALCGIHLVKPIGCWVFPESSLLPVRDLKKHVNAIPTCAILKMPDVDLPLAADLELLAARDIQFEHTKQYFAQHDSFEERPWREATDRLAEKLRDAAEITRRAEAIRARAEALTSR
ncbi:YkgJ family cysteine cluster protein [Methanocella sp. MCL-LM]|uniref:YkgJ family cysteine cluster protein n=1 Tax=Methanocella sp. MCL-LM TaxID=3412035 RepID=UPI003C74E3D1